MTEKRPKPAKQSGSDNQWVREAVAHSGLSYGRIADALTARGLGMTYDKTTIYKMTRDRHVRKDEAEAISEITGYPLIPGDEASDLHRRLQELSPKNRRIVEQLIHALELEQGASDQ